MNLLDRYQIMKAEHLTEEKVWSSHEIKDIPHRVNAELRTDVPGLEKEEVFVWGEPFRLGEVLDSRQGYDNPYGAFGTCGKTAVANVCTMAGLHVTEPEVLKYAMDNDLCDTFDPKLHSGATTIGNQIALLEHYGLDAHCEFAAETASPERLAAALEGGYGIVAALNSGLLQHHDWKV